ncbi:hypothetical protein ASPFODRAFT_704465 [Aspergillus luchuensis CBS 106.47]|uniref:Uncharacterized protein n=1 Tax=Aspergillus luchuensis (strain CBS 106.47) TaxID=1137211 RepID=A0A1M3T2Z2_ASPLC|nr:hypothetical protein ASPFODRAFT_704465 [Aspergillus luchuensis CBS 106.47]
MQVFNLPNSGVPDVVSLRALSHRSPIPPGISRCEPLAPRKPTGPHEHPFAGWSHHHRSHVPLVDPKLASVC